jgi:cation transport ATPase
VIDMAELRRMSQAERQELARLLAELDVSARPAGPPVASAQPAAPAHGAASSEAAAPGPPPGPLRADPYRIDPSLRRERRLALLVSAACCVVLAGWIVLLAATLPHHFSAHQWRAVWVNFDVFLFAAFAVTAWAIWRERQVLILLLMLIGTMLCCDAWFDVGTSLATSGLWVSLLSAVFAELPLAFLAFAGARRLLRATVAAGILAGAHAGATIPAGEWGRSCAGQSLRRAHLAGLGLDEALPRGQMRRQADRAA